MEKFSGEISDRLTQKLDNQKEYYTPEDLLESGFPFFIAKRVENYAAENAVKQLDKPESQWTQMDSEAVKLAWKGFLQAASRNVQIHRDLINSLVQEAVAETLGLIVQPEKFVPRFFHEDSEELEFESAKERTNELHVNRQLGLALVQYMTKKEKARIAREQTDSVIQVIDRKLTENYHPLNWAQLLRPLFELAGPEVEPELLRLFFEDKGKARIARAFDLLEGPVTETEFVELLSSPEMLDFAGYEDDQQKLFTESEEITETDQLEHEPVEPEPQEPSDELSAETDIEESEHISYFESEDELLSEEYAQTKPVIEEKVDLEKQDEQQIADLFSIAESPEPEKMDETEPNEPDTEDESDSIETVDDSSDETEEDQDSEEIQPLLNRFTLDESSIEIEKKQPEESTGTIYDELDLVKNASEVEAPFTLSSETEDESDSSVAAEEDFTERVDDDDFEETDEEAPWEGEHQERIEREEGKEPDGEVPMWKSFLERDEFDSESGFQFDRQEGSKRESEQQQPPQQDQAPPESETEESEESGFIEEPIYDFSEPEVDPGEKIEDISKWLIDDKDRFVEKIFQNSELAYDQALSEIVDFEDWKRASVYLEKEVFSRNRIDIYDETAVDFTDRLHSYFMQYKS
jgi:hypothetical protein